MKKVLLAVVVLSLMGCDKSQEKSKPTISSNSEKTEQTSHENEISNWSYDSSKDEMRGIEKKFASTISTNKVYFDFPYEGGSSLQLAIRQIGDDDIEVLFVISKGQFLCGIDGCNVAYKFDDGIIDSSELSPPSDHSSNVLFISGGTNARAFIYAMRKSKKLTVELPFYQSGNKQFQFDVSGFKWDESEDIPVNKTQPEQNSMIDSAQ